MVTTTVAVGIPSIRSSALTRLAVWFLVALPFYAWLVQHTNGVWFIAALVTSVGLYTLHLLTQVLATSETERPTNAEVVLFHANGLALFLCLYVRSRECRLDRGGRSGAGGLERTAGFCLPPTSG